MTDELIGTDFFAEPSPETGQGGAEQPVSPTAGEPTSGPAAGELEAENKKQAESQRILNKFDGIDGVEQSYIALADELGAELPEFNTEEELIQGYIELEKEYGRRKSGQEPTEIRHQKPQPQAQQSPEVLQLAQQVAMQQQQMQQMMQYMQYMAMQNQQRPEAAPKREEIDPQKLLDKFYENPVEAIREAVSPYMHEQLNQNIGQLQQQMAPIQQQIQTYQVQQQWEAQARQVKQQLPDFDDYNDSIAAEFRKDPYLTQLVTSHPQGMAMALRQAYDRAKIAHHQQQMLATNQQQMKQYQQTLQSQLQTNAQNIANKQAARLQAGGGGNRRVLRRPTQDEMEVEAFLSI